MRTPNRLLGIVALALGLTGCAALTALLPASDNYGEICTSDEDCTDGLSCVDSPREEGSYCLANPVGRDGDTCYSYLECESGLRCDMATSTCMSGGLGLPDCDDDGDCDEGEICNGGTCEAPE